jgi:predicted MPP superfamily phosphohydrolase
MHHQSFFFITVFTGFTLINLYILRRSRQALPESKIIRMVFYVIFGFFCSAFLIAMLGRNHLPIVVQKILYSPGTVWFGIMMYLLMFFILTDILYFIIRLFCYCGRSEAQTRNPLKRNIKHYRKIQVLSGYIIVICLSVYGYYQFRHPHVTEQKISIAKNAGEYKKLKVVGVSDLHLGVAIDKKRLEEYVGLINAQHPDMIIIAGDLIDNNVLPLEKERMWEVLNDLRAPLGTYLCLGNHEYLVGIEAGMNFLQKTNIRLLIDNSAVINESIQIIGRDDRLRGSNRKPLKELVKDLDIGLPLILLDHQPFHLEEAEENGIDFQFSGHTHYGQIFPGNLLVKRMYELPYGYKQKGNTHYYVSSGLGLWGPPFRIGTRSEIVVFNIEFK